MGSEKETAIICVDCLEGVHNIVIIICILKHKGRGRLSNLHQIQEHSPTCNQKSRQFERKLAKECRTNNKGIWNYIRNRTNTRGGIGQLFKEDGTLTQGDREAAEVLNQHFFKTFTKEDTTNIPHVTPKNLTTETLTTFEITEELVKKCLLQLKTDKSPGTDGISPRILKEMSELPCVPLNTIFKLSIDTSTLPR